MTHGEVLRHTGSTTTRSEYRRKLGHSSSRPCWSRPASELRPPADTDGVAIAALLLDAYRGTIDDEGESESEALQAAQLFLRRCQSSYSLVVVERGSIVAMSFVVVVNECHYVDPVATAAPLKGMGIGRAIVDQSLSLLAANDVDQVGAVVTDGNVPSERLFASLDFTRVGAWR